MPGLPHDAASPQGTMPKGTVPQGSVTEPTGALNGPGAGAYGAPEMHCEATRLMTKAQAGDAAAFEELFRTLRGRAFQVAKSLVGSREDALDLTQEAFTKLYSARGSYDPGQPFLPWFHRILRNACFSFLRKRGHARPKSLQGLDEEGEDTTLDLVDPGVAPSHAVEAADEQQLFQRALERLAARDREILALRHFEELSYKEIAAALDIPEGTVMSRLFHARRRLRELLGPALGIELEEVAP